MQDVWDYRKDKTIEDNTKIQDMRYSMLSVVFCHSWIRDIYKRIKCSYIEYWYRARFDFILNDIYLCTEKHKPRNIIRVQKKRTKHRKNMIKPKKQTKRR